MTLYSGRMGGGALRRACVMKLQYHLPRPDLREYVRAYYLFEASSRTVQPLAAELGNIRCIIRGEGRLIPPGGGEMPVAQTTLIGPTMSAYALEAEAGMRAFGVGILPRGWRVFFGVDASELADRIVDLTGLAGSCARQASEEVRNAGSLAEMAQAADRFFAEMLERRQAAAGRYPTALEEWLARPDDLDTLMKMMDCSRRQVDRLAKRYFGASPKLLQRKYRALRAADRILFGGAKNWMEAAGDRFYDQSHFIKEFRTFVGATPLEFANARATLAKTAQTERRRLTLGQHSAAL
ncbi:MAG: helix-turn-helix domain-containing protein [Alphaproteobacteria bacterium]|nr:helix-turn-helix domain-containing protein [Alphaproteobacteria bacterium]